jgi:hypothetical protein
LAGRPESARQLVLAYESKVRNGSTRQAAGDRFDVQQAVQDQAVVCFRLVADSRTGYDFEIHTSRIRRLPTGTPPVHHSDDAMMTPDYGGWPHEAPR